jgi:hypothetical protein
MASYGFRMTLDVKLKMLGNNVFLINEFFSMDHRSQNYLERSYEHNKLKVPIRTTLKHQQG